MSSDEKKDAKVPVPMCRICGIDALNAQAGRIDGATGCCIPCMARRDAFAISLVNGYQDGLDEEGYAMDEEELMAWARGVYRNADALLVARQTAELPPSGEKPS